VYGKNFQSLEIRKPK